MLTYAAILIGLGFAAGVGVQAGEVTCLPSHRPRRDGDVMPSAVGRLTVGSVALSRLAVDNS